MRNQSNYDNLFVKCINRDHANFILFRSHTPEIKKVHYLLRQPSYVVITCAFRKKKKLK